MFIRWSESTLEIHDITFVSEHHATRNRFLGILWFLPCRKIPRSLCFLPCVARSRLFAFIGRCNGGRNTAAKERISTGRGKALFIHNRTRTLTCAVVRTCICMYIYIFYTKICVSAPTQFFNIYVHTVHSSTWTWSKYFLKKPYSLFFCIHCYEQILSDT